MISGLKSLILFINFLFCFESSGYFESNVDIYSKRNTNYLGYNKIRLDFEKKISNGIDFNLSLIGKNNFGLRYLNSEDFTPYNEKNNFHYYDTLQTVFFFIDHLFFSYNKSNFKLLMGKQPIYYGSGFIWNPVNKISFKNVLDPNYEIQGNNAFRLHFFAQTYDFDLIIIPEEKGDEISLFTSIGSSIYNNYLRLHVFRYLNKTYKDNELLYDLDNYLGLTYSGNLIFDIGSSFEVVKKINSKSLEWTVSFDYTFNYGLNIMYERFHQDLSYEYNSEYPIDLIQNYLLGFINPIGEDYSFFSLSYQIDDYNTISFQSINNISDKSSILIPSLYYSLYDDVDLSFYFYKFNGDYTTEFGINDWSFKIRVQIYF